MFLVPRRRLSQPQYGPQINPKWGLRPAFAWLAAMPSAALINQGSFTRSASLTDSMGLPGRVVTCVGNTTNGFTRTGGSTAAQTKCTFVSIFRWVSGAANNFPQLMGFSGTNSSFRLGAGPAGGGDLGLVKGGVVALSTITLTSGTWYAVVCSHRQDTGEYYLIARPLGGGGLLRAAATNTTASTAGNGTYAVGISRTDYAGSWNGDVAMGFASFDFLSEAAGRELLESSLTIFQPTQTATTVASAGGRVAVATDTITLSDSALADVSKVAAASDTLTLSDSAVSQTDRIAAASDTVTLSDSAVGSSSLPVAATDTIALSDSAAATSSLAVAASDTITLSDSATSQTDRAAATADTVTLSDSATSYTDRIATATDTIALSDSAAAVGPGFTAGATDTITLSDSAVATSLLVSAGSDSIALSDSAAAIINAIAAAVDSIALADFAVAARPGAVAASVRAAPFMANIGAFMVR